MHSVTFAIMRADERAPRGGHPIFIPHDTRHNAVSGIMATNSMDGR